MTNTIDIEAPFTVYKLAELLHVKAHVLDHMPERGEGGGFIVLRGSRGKGQVRYPQEAVRRWLNSTGANRCPEKAPAQDPSSVEVTRCSGNKILQNGRRNRDQQS
jgi:hypothetical protein